MLTISVTLVFIHTIANAWHENLGIDANKAAELYQTKPNDPAIVQWKNTLQLAINDMGKCLDVETAISCEQLMSTIISNCNSHPNELLSCSDARIPQYPSVLKKSMDKCFDIATAISCEPYMSTIVINCNLHPNGSLACSDARIPQYPSILKNAKEEQDKRQQQQEAIIKEELANSLANYNKCIMHTNMTSEDCSRIANENLTKSILS